MATRSSRRGSQTQYGEFQNAEELIRAHSASQDPALRRALLAPVDLEATEEVKGDLKAAAGKFDLAEGEKVVDAAVRGNALVAVIDAGNGQLYKAVTGANDDYEAPAVTPAEAAATAQADADRKLQAEAAKLRQENELEIAEMRADLEAQQAEALAKPEGGARRRRRGRPGGGR